MLNLKPIIARSAETEGSGAAAPASTRTKRSVRDYIDATGTIVDSMEKATGSRYAVLGDDGKTIVHTEDYQFGVNPQVDRQLAIFGHPTKFGNVLNSVMNNRDRPDATIADAVDALIEFRADLEAGVWAERTGGGLPKIDRDALADACVTVGVATGKVEDTDEARATAKATQLEKFEKDRKYFANVRKVPAVLKEYARLTGAQELTAEETLAF